jgi:pantoate--beta-alanine ligase
VTSLRELAIVSTRSELGRARAAMRGPVAVVMTMGALHEGHASLLRAARADADTVIATIFVNPLQFGPAEDFSRYPRTLEADLEVLRSQRVDAVFVPSIEDMYPKGQPAVRVDPGPLATVLEGAVRPGHFDGVLTVVLKLLNLTRADAAYFGEKDYQQLTLIRSMVDDLDVPTRIVGVPTVREPDGLALSSRNQYLSTVDRIAALALSRSLRVGVAAGAAGAGPAGVLAAARADLAGTPAVVPDYLELTDPWLGPAPATGKARLLVAAKVGQTRLIDNLEIELR